ncbi:hypothetical protein J6590_053387, partial [Homalodisca vitripennis]
MKSSLGKLTYLSRPQQKEQANNDVFAADQSNKGADCCNSVCPHNLRDCMTNEPAKPDILFYFHYG